MGDLFLLSKSQMARISLYFPLAHGVSRVDSRRVVRGIVYVIRNSLQCMDAMQAVYQDALMNDVAIVAYIAGSRCC